LRASSTEAEMIFWDAVRNKKLGVRFVRQFSIDGYVIDFYCPKFRLAIELEGKIHKFQKKHDEHREKYLKAFGIKIIKFKNEEILQNLNTVLSTVSPLLHQERG